MSHRNNDKFMSNIKYLFGKINEDLYFYPTSRPM